MTVLITINTCIIYMIHLNFTLKYFHILINHSSIFSIFSRSLIPDHSISVLNPDQGVCVRLRPRVSGLSELAYRYRNRYILLHRGSAIVACFAIGIAIVIAIGSKHFQ